MQAEETGSPATRRPGRPALIALAVLLLTAGAWTAGWYYVAGVFRAGIERWAAARRTEGLQMGWTALAVGGFPFHWRAHLVAPAIARVGPAPGWFWRAGTLTLDWRPWAPRSLGFAAPGTHRLGVDPALPETVLAGTAGAASGRIDLAEDGRLRQVTVKMAGATLARGGSAPARLERADATLTVFPPNAAIAASGPDSAQEMPPPHPQAARLDAAVTGLTLPGNGLPALGATIARLALSATLMEPLPAAPLRTALSAWSARGGTVEIESLALDWGGLQLRGDGTLALDADLQPLAAASVRLSGYNETVDALAAAGVISPRTAFMTKVILGTMGKNPPDGGPPEIQVPLSVQEGRVFIGPVALLNLPRITWPDR